MQSSRRREKQVIQNRRIKKIQGMCIPVVVRGRLLCCPLQDLKQDVGCRVTPSYKVTKVVKILRSDKLQQLNLHTIAIM